MDPEGPQMVHKVHTIIFEMSLYCGYMRDEDFMIVRIQIQSLFLPDKYFSRKLEACRNQPKGRHGWRFIHMGQSLVFRDDDTLEELASFVGLEAQSFIGLLRAQLSSYKSLVGIECNDGLFVHPVALGKFLIELKTKKSLKSVNQLEG